MRNRLVNTFPILHGIPADRALRTGWLINEDIEWEKLLKQFSREYGFGDTAGRRSHFYALAGHMNHGCTNCANARFLVDGSEPFGISVWSKKPIRRDEEILIDYGKKKLTYGCARCGNRDRGQQTESATRRLLKTAGHKLNPRNWLRNEQEQ